ncbi:MAG: DegQ family serine endoprotease [Geminicoccaceae bacterium]|nr:DegQ family serine endoprotease [Geminicoccaceae bacterium]
MKRVSVSLPARRCSPLGWHGTWRALLVLACLAAGATSAAAQGGLPPLQGFSALVETVGPAVVNISTAKAGAPAPEAEIPKFPPGSPFEEFFKDFFNEDGKGDRPQQPRRSFSLGSGFVVDPAGFVVTNNHVIADADEVTVIFSDESEYKAEIVGRDTKTDLALLKIQRAKPFPFVQWADSDAVKVGDWMVAIGNPFGLGFSVTAGIVSARGRDIQAGPYDDFFQVDAAINRGNSGGPSFTLDGKVFGVNTAIFSPSGGNVGIGFAIPSNLARNVIDSLKDSGRVARGWLGVRIQSVTDEIAESLGLQGTTTGALIASVTEGGPAEDAGIQAGDVVLAFDGKPIDRMRSLPRMVAETPIGEAVDVEVWRQKARRHLSVTLGELPEDESVAGLESGDAPPPAGDGPEKIEPLGLSVAGMDDATRSRFQLGDDAKGVVIVEVEADSPAGSESLQPGDLVSEVNQQEIGSPEEMLAKVMEAQGEGKKSVLLLIDRQGDLRFVALRFRHTG